MSDMFLIEKRGLYYRPDARGYTGLKSEAGRYSFEEAAERVGPNGPDGPQDGMGMWREDEAPEYSQSCAWDVKMKDKAFKDGYAAGRASLTPTDADLELAVRAALEAAADVVTRVTVPGQPWVGVVGRLHAAHSIRALDPAAIVASVKRGEGE
jgi:hypothetical protein